MAFPFPFLSRRPLARILAGILLLLAGVQITVLIHSQVRVREAALAQGRSEARRMAQVIQGRLQGLEGLARNLAADLQAGRVSPGELPRRLRADLEGAPDAYRLGVVFVPNALGRGIRLRAPFVLRDQGVLRPLDLEAGQDYTQGSWYWEGLARDGWGEPHLSVATRRVIAGFSIRFRLPGSGEVSGMVRVNLSVGELRQILATASLGRTGYSALLSARGAYLAHPMEEWVKGERTIFQTADELGDPLLGRAGEWAQSGARGEGESTSTTGRQPIWLFAEPVPTAGWSLQACVFQSEMARSPLELRRAIILLVCTLLGALACLGLEGVHLRDLPSLWRGGILVALLLGLGIATLWGLTLAMPDPPPDTATPILGRENLDAFLEGVESRTLEGRARPLRIPTGIQVETLRFGTANDIVVAGRIWQRYPADYPATAQRGFLLPDAEDAGIREGARVQDGTGIVEEFPFKATLRQEFASTVKYPFDQAVIHLRLLPRERVLPLTFVPDLGAYPVLSPAALPGIARDLVLTGWRKERSYFGYVDGLATTRFGLAQGVLGRTQDFSFQLVLSRNFLDPFISGMLPPMVVAWLLFTLLLAGTQDAERAKVMGYRPMDILRAAGTLLFPVMYAQISLRGRLAVAGLIYLEYIYFILYAMILLVAANALAFAMGKGGDLVAFADNAIAKIFYWPVLLGALFALSLVFLY